MSKPTLSIGQKFLIKIFSTAVQLPFPLSKPRHLQMERSMEDHPGPSFRFPGAAKWKEINIIRFILDNSSFFSLTAIITR